MPVAFEALSGTCIHDLHHIGLGVNTASKVPNCDG
jgi:hypothetical protein